MPFIRGQTITTPGWLWKECELEAYGDIVINFHWWCLGSSYSASI